MPTMPEQPNEEREIVVVNGQQFEVVKELKQNTEQTFNRVTIVESIYHENNDGPHQIHAEPFSYQLESDEQTYTRIMSIGTEWTKLDTGWLSNKVSMIYLLNKEGKMGPVRPIDKQIDEVNSRIIQICKLTYVDGKPYHIPVSYLSPRKSIRLEPNGPEGNLVEDYYLRCLSGSCKIQVSCLPL